ASTIHLNHPRGSLGGFTYLQVDTDTLATHADPREFNMAVQPGSSGADTLLLSSDFNAMEILNSGVDEYLEPLVRPMLNDWFTLLSRGQLVAGTGTSDTHKKFADAAGYYRSFVKVGVDTPAEFHPLDLCDAVNAMKVVATNTPFVKTTAVRVNAQGQPTSPVAELGDVLEPSTDDVEVTVQVQVPEFTDISRIELYTWRPGDDGRCPMDPTSAQAKTTRVACNGVENKNWPQASIAATRAVTLTSANLVNVRTVGSTTYRRWQTTQKFRLAAPATDNWIVALVYGSKSIFPLVYKASSSGGSEPVTPFAMSNPILVDADGGGYDKPPFNTSLPPLKGPVPPPPQKTVPLVREPPSPERLLEVWGDAFSHTGGRGAVQ
ncbi:MAG: hypothetical protein ACK4N5_17230, partial [Myxococcales bacterium]